MRETVSMDVLCGRWAVYSLLSDFLDAPADFFQKLHELPELSRPDLAKGDPDGEDFRYTYDDLFKGTSADIYIPLWASCIKEHGCLLDETTLRVIRVYHRLGYAPAEMDGNPPDYLGQQFRFLAYLCACENRQAEVGDTRFSIEEYEDTARDFISDFTLDTVRVVSQGIRENAKDPCFLAVAGLMTDLMAEDDSLNLADIGAAIRKRVEAQEPQPQIRRSPLQKSPTGAPMSPAEALQRPAGLQETAGASAYGSLHPADVLLCFENSLRGPGETIPDDVPHVIKTSGRNNCGGKCAINATVCDGCILEVSTGCDIGDPQLHACLRGRSYRQTYMNGRRLRYPMIRRAPRGTGLFRRVSWEEAADYTATELRRLTDAHGPGCRYINYATGITGLMRPTQLAQRFLNLTGGCLTYYGSYSSINTGEASAYTFGTAMTGNSPEDLYNTKLLILWAHNPVSTIFGTQLRMVLTELKTRGVRIVVIDPRRSDSAISLADEWIPIVPSTDGALADAMAYTIWSEGLQDQHFMDTCCVGFDAEHMPEGVPAELNYHDYLFGIADDIVKTPEWAAGITGIPAETIRRLALEYGSTKPACILPGLGNQRTGNGEQTARGMMALTCLTGNVGIPGGGAAGNGMAIEEPMPDFPRGENPYKGVISCFIWPKAIEEGHLMTREKDHIKGMEQLSADLKFMFNLAGNALINQHSDVNRTIRLLQDDRKLECIVSSDVFMTPSMRFTDVLLPGPSFLEEEDINTPWRYGHYILAENAAVSPVFGCRSEYGFIADLAKRFGVWEAWSDGCPDRTAHLEYLYAQFASGHPDLELPDIREFMTGGGYTYQNRPSTVAFAAQIGDPEHVPFPTPTGKVEIVSKRLYDWRDPLIPAHPGYVPCKEGPADPLRKKYPIQLIGYHTKRRCHSTHDNNPILEEADPQLLWIHPDDAAARGIRDKEMVRIYNDRGSIRIRCKVTDRVLPGVAALSQGAWYTPDRMPAAGDAAAYPDDIRGNINTITAFEPTPLAKGNPQHTNLVEIERYAASTASHH